MKRLAVAALLLLSIACFAFACPGTNQCGCDESAPQEVDLSVVDALAYNTDLALATASELANGLVNDQYGATQTVQYLKSKGVSDEKIKPIADLPDKIGQVLQRLEPEFMSAVAFFQYGRAINDGTVIGKLQAATAYARAIAKLSPVIKELTETSAEAAKVRELAMKLVDSVDGGGGNTEGDKSA